MVKGVPPGDGGGVSGAGVSVGGAGGAVPSPGAAGGFCSLSPAAAGGATSSAPAGCPSGDGGGAEAAGGRGGRSGGASTPTAGRVHASSARENSAPVARRGFKSSGISGLSDRGGRRLMIRRSLRTISYWDSVSLPYC